jgi:GNAT superfamily N-acetyltransferase
METARQASRAETLRREGEEALRALGDLDVDSDSENEDDDAAGFTGRARRNLRRERGGEKPLGEAPPEIRDVRVRAVTPAELGMAYAWMRRDQRRYANAVRFWDTAASSIQAAFEERGEETNVLKQNENVGGLSSSRVLGAFCDALGPAPVAFAVLKSDGLVVDAMGVRQGLRRLGFGRALALELVRRAKRAAAELAGPPEYVIDALPSSVPFWETLGFKPCGGTDSPTTRVMRRLCGDVAMAVDLLEDPPEPRGDEWWLPARRKRFGDAEA